MLPLKLTAKSSILKPRPSLSLCSSTSMTSVSHNPDPGTGDNTPADESSEATESLLLDGIGSSIVST